MDIHALIKAIEETAPPCFQASWDCSGIQVASTKTAITHLGLALDPTPSQILRAVEQGCDAILTHHPLSLKPTLPHTLNAYHASLRTLFCHDVLLYAAHTSLDTNLTGPAAWLADALALQDRCALEPMGDDTLRGFGLVGMLPDPIPNDLFIQKLIDLVPEKTATICGTLPTTVQRVAYCTGSGASLLPLAEHAKADVYVSGDIKYHAALDAGIAIIDVGHHSLEETMMEVFSQRLRKQLAGITVTFFASQSPFRLLRQEIQEDL